MSYIKLYLVSKYIEVSNDKPLQSVHKDLAERNRLISNAVCISEEY